MIAARLNAHAEVGRNKSSQFRHRLDGTRLPELRTALFRPKGQATKLLALLLCLIPLASTSLAPAEDNVLAEEEEIIIDPGFEVSESTFHQRIFNTQDLNQGLRQIESLLTLKVDAIHHVCHLTEDQMAKLQLAGQGDIKRFCDEVDVARAKFMKVRRNRNAFNNFLRDVQPLQNKVNAGLFGQTSFFQKVLNRSLSDEQSATYEEAERERRHFRYNARLRLLVLMMERNMPLRAEQRERFIGVLKEQTTPAKAPGKVDYYVALYQLSKIPDQKLKPIFDDAQWKVLEQFKARGLAFEAIVKQQRVVP